METPFCLAFRCIVLRDKELQRQHNRLAQLKSAETTPITIPANSKVVIIGFSFKMLQRLSTVATQHSTNNSVIPTDLDIVPPVTTFDLNQQDTICTIT